ncbi:hypothetical protein EC2729250_3022 [Escherichia coli 2729250]|nr:hypothetical protein EC2729250_3022 [Escherichia coli 2729250]
MRTFSGDLISEASGTSLPPSAPAGQTGRFPVLLTIYGWIYDQFLP